MSNEGKVSLTDESVQVKQNIDFSNKKTNVFRPQEGKNYRIKFMTEEVVMRKRHYSPITKKYYRCKEFEGYCPICVAASSKSGPDGKDNKIKRATDTYGVNILVYDTDDNGKVTSPLSAEIYFWAFGSDKFVDIRNIISEWGSILDIDLNVVCKDAQFQKLSFTPLKKCLYRDSGEEFKQYCDNKFKSEKYPEDKFLCRDVPVKDLFEVFGLKENIPENVRSQMGDNIAIDRANQAPVAHQEPPKKEFEDIENLGSLL